MFTLPLNVSVIDGSLRQAVNIACEAELEHVRKVVNDLTAKVLAPLPLSDVVLELVRREHEWDEKRGWQRAPVSILIKAAILETDTHVVLDRDAPDAAVVAAASRNAIDDRAEATRAVFKQLLFDLL